MLITPMGVLSNLNSRAASALLKLCLLFSSNKNALKFAKELLYDKFQGNSGGLNRFKKRHKYLEKYRHQC